MKKNDPQRGPGDLREVLGQLFVSRGWARLGERAKLEAAWLAAAGEVISKDTRVASLRRGVLDIEVRNGVLMQELAQFHKRGLLQKLRAVLPGTTVTDLKFRSANWA